MSRRTGGPVKFVFIGVMPAAELGAYAYDSLLTQIKAARKQFQQQHRLTRRTVDDFCEAWVYGVSSKVTKFAQDNPVPGKQANALVLVEQQEHAAIRAWIANRHENVGTRKQNKRDGYNHAAIQLGNLADEQASINKAATKKSSGVLMPS